MRKHPHSHREAKATAPVLDSTPDYAQTPRMSVTALIATITTDPGPQKC